MSKARKRKSKKVKKTLLTLQTKYPDSLQTWLDEIDPVQTDTVEEEPKRIPTPILRIQELHEQVRQASELAKGILNVAVSFKLLYNLHAARRILNGTRESRSTRCKTISATLSRYYNSDYDHHPWSDMKYFQWNILATSRYVFNLLLRVRSFEASFFFELTKRVHR